MNKELININRKKKGKRDLQLRVKNWEKRRKGKEEEEKRGKLEGKYKGVGENKFKGKIMYKYVFFKF